MGNRILVVLLIAIEAFARPCPELWRELDTHAGDPEISRLNRLVREEIDRQLETLPPHRRPAFLKALRDVGSLPVLSPEAGLGEVDGTMIRMATHLQSHPYGRVVFAHELQHVRDKIALGRPVGLRDFWQKATVRGIVLSTERPAWGAQYDFLHRSFTREDLARYQKLVDSEVREGARLQDRLERAGVLSSRGTFVKFRPEAAADLHRYLEIHANFLMMRDLEAAFSRGRNAYIEHGLDRYRAKSEFQDQLQGALKLVGLGMLPIYAAVIGGAIAFSSPEESETSPNSAAPSPPGSYAATPSAPAPK